MELVSLVEALKRALAAPGEYDSTFPNSTEDGLKGLLADAVAEAQMDGLLSSITLDVDTATVTPDLLTAQQALVVLYAMGRVVYARISNLKNHTRYKAGGVEAEVEQSATILTELLKEIRDRKKQVLADARSGDAGSAFYMVDQYVARAIGSNSYAHLV